MPVLGERAVVLGASMGGLLAARVLTNFYRTVTVVERDVLQYDPANRRGVPQGRHVHALLPRGAHILDELRTALVSVGLGLVAFLFHLIAIGRPGPWGDEAVTVLSVRRSLDSLATSLKIHEGVAGWIRIDAMVWLIGLGGILLAAWRARQDPAVRVTVVLTTGWLVLPTAVLLAYSLVATPVFEERYVAASAPALAMAMALALVCVPSPRSNRAVAAVLVVLLMSLSSGAWERYHQTWAKSGWLSIAQAVQANKKPGDVVVAAGPLEAVVVVLPDEFSGLDVINVKVPYYADNTPWGTVTMIRDDPKLLNGLHRVWYLSVEGITAADAAAFTQQGFTERWSKQEYGLGAILYERD
jgi:hypothetical protein